MRITDKLILKVCSVPLNKVQYLNLSKRGIGVIESLSACVNLHTLILHGNNIEAVENLECCSELWTLDLSHNKVKSLEGLSKFIGLGTFNLSYNQITWMELTKIRHLRVLDIHLNGNEALDRDPNYRLHVIDCLPNAWSVDGRPVTSSERRQVVNFFRKMENSTQPVRHKLPRDLFVATPYQNIHVNGIFGQYITQLYLMFPLHGPDNIEMDRKKLLYFAQNFEDEIFMTRKFAKTQKLVCQSGFMEQLLTSRSADRESSNILLLLLVASLEFVLPRELVAKALHVVRLNRIGDVNCFDLFLLPRDLRWSVAIILLTAAKLDRESHQDGGLYDQLYLCLHCIMAELGHLRYLDDLHARQIREMADTLQMDNRILLASEVVHLLCAVPILFELICTDIGVRNLIITATGGVHIVNKISQMVPKMSSPKDNDRVYRDMADRLLTAVQYNSAKVFTKSYRRLRIDQHLLDSQSSIGAVSNPIQSSDYLTSGRGCPTPTHPVIGHVPKPQRPYHQRIPRLADEVLLSPQVLGRIISIPEPSLVMVQLSAASAMSGASVNAPGKGCLGELYHYVNTSEMQWDADSCYWRPVGTVGDRISLHSACEDQDDSPDVGKNPRPPDESTSSDKSLLPTPQTTHSQTGGHDSAPDKQPVINSSSQSKASSLPRPISTLLAEKLDLKLDMGDHVTRQHKPHSQRHSQTTNQVDEDVCEEHLSTRVQDVLDQLGADNIGPGLHNGVVRTESVDHPRTAGEIESSADDHVMSSRAETKTTIIVPSLTDVCNSSVDADIPESGPISAMAAPRPSAATNSHRDAVLTSQNDAADHVTKLRFANGNRADYRTSDAYRHLARLPDHVTPDRHYVGLYYKTPYQIERTDSWRNSSPTTNHTRKRREQVHVTSALQQNRLAYNSPQTIGDKIVGGNFPHSSIRRVDGWLGGGKDLYKQELLSRPRPKMLPGWKEGMRARTSLSRTNHNSKTSLTPFPQSNVNLYSGSVYGYSTRDAIHGAPQQQITIPRDRTARRFVYGEYSPMRRPVPVCDDCSMSPGRAGVFTPNNSYSILPDRPTSADLVTSQ